MVMRMLSYSVILVASAAANAAETRALFDLTVPAAAREWQPVHDRVMGGRSSGGVTSSDAGIRFSGRLSLANNGGFASIRSRNSQLNLSNGDTVILSVRGDGRTYSLNLYPQRRRTAFSFRASFPTKKDEWTRVEIPLSSFQATSFGRRVRISLKPEQITGLGILLGDKKPGPFQIEIRSIAVARGPVAPNSAE